MTLGIRLEELSNFQQESLINNMSSILLKTEDALYSIINGGTGLEGIAVHRSGDQDKLILPCINITAESSEERPTRGLGNFMVTVNIELHTSFDDVTRDGRIVLNDALIDLLNDDDIVSVLSEAVEDYRCFGVLYGGHTQKVSNRAHIYGMSFQVVCCNSDAEEIEEPPPEEGEEDISSLDSNAPIFTTNIVNSLPVVRFDGIDDYLTIANAAGNKATTDLIVFILFALSGSSGESAIMTQEGPPVDSPVTGPNPFIWNISSSADDHGDFVTYTADSYSDNFFLEGTGIPEDSAFHLIMCLYKDDGTVIVHLDAINRSLNSSGSPSGVLETDTGAIRLGGYVNQFSSNPRLKGDIAEVLMFTSTISTSARNDIESHLMQKYDLGAGTVMSDEAIIALTPSVWLKADEITLNNGDGIGTWRDKSGNDFDAIVS